MNIAPLRDFVLGMTTLLERTVDEAACIAETRRLLATLIASDDWLPPPFAAPHPEHYQQYLLHCDPRERFSVVSFVWGPGQRTPIHDHTVWGLIGVLRGAETSRRYTRGPDGRLTAHEAARCEPGAIEIVSPTLGDIHEVANALPDRASISIHVYGANIGAVRRHAFDPLTGAAKVFVSGYSSPEVPNLWDRSVEARSG
ncbi:MAG: cysteine dioxygenase [Gammaproteobacteria bacterium]